MISIDSQLYAAFGRLLQASQRFCAELEEDGEGVPQAELKELHAAMDDVEVNLNITSQ